MQVIRIKHGGTRGTSIKMAACEVMDALYDTGRCLSQQQLVQTLQHCNSSQPIHRIRTRCAGAARAIIKRRKALGIELQKTCSFISVQTIGRAEAFNTNNSGKPLCVQIVVRGKQCLKEPISAAIRAVGLCSIDRGYRFHECSYSGQNPCNNYCISPHTNIAEDRVDIMFDGGAPVHYLWSDSQKYFRREGDVPLEEDAISTGQI